MSCTRQGTSSFGYSVNPRPFHFRLRDSSLIVAPCGKMKHTERRPDARTAAELVVHVPFNRFGCRSNYIRPTRKTSDGLPVLPQAIASR
ncbi:hypothetical protein AVEN_103823-1 [Araneus ventricosus]|uniref:Uncharacterized protein n=1 Tax=Araneus ventricosus TaxID=182803 RepID=A0A4Y2SM97_ARAVE|nr:hypothetical protein AVEN_103823-1 [Araneus ventricosus]